jgi:hypothetical protein
LRKVRIPDGFLQDAEAKHEFSQLPPLLGEIRSFRKCLELGLPPVEVTYVPVSTEEAVERSVVPRDAAMNHPSPTEGKPDSRGEDDPVKIPAPKAAVKRIGCNVKVAGFNVPFAFFTAEWNRLELWRNEVGIRASSRNC